MALVEEDDAEVVGRIPRVLVARSKVLHRRDEDIGVKIGGRTRRALDLEIVAEVELELLDGLHRERIPVDKKERPANTANGPELRDYPGGVMVLPVPVAIWRYIRRRPA